MNILQAMTGLYPARAGAQKIQQKGASKVALFAVFCQHLPITGCRCNRCRGSNLSFCESRIIYERLIVEMAFNKYKQELKTSFRRQLCQSLEL